MRSLALAAALALLGCGKPRQTGPVLSIGDQLQTLQVLLKAAGEDKPAHYRIEWANFIGGPAVIAAETGNSVDVGFMAETPMVFAQAAGSPVKVVAVSQGIEPGSSNNGLVVPEDSPIRSARDLAGKRVGYGFGTVNQYLVARYLQAQGLTLKDVVSVQSNGLAATNVLNGTLDAMALSEPVLTENIVSGKLRALAYTGAPYTPGFGFLVSPEKALADPAKSALIGDFVARVARAYRWQRTHVAQAAPSYAASHTISPALAAQILERTPQRFTPITPSVIALQQGEEDMLFRQGVVKKPLNAAEMFDNRYAGLIAAAEAGHE